MADLSDVSNAFVALIAGYLYPNGPDAPSLLGLDARIYAGWPIPADLKADLAARPSISHVSVYPRRDEHNTTRYNDDDWEEVSRPTPTLTLTPSANGDGSTLIAITGSVPPASAQNPQNVAVFVNGQPYLYAVAPTDTPMTIAQALATQIAANVPGAVPAQAAIYLPAGARVGALRVGVTGIVEQELARQEKLWQIGIWAAGPGIRDTLGKNIDALLKSTRWLSLADGTQGRNIYRSSHQSDQLEREGCYRRDLLYTVEFATIQTQSAPEIIVARTDIQSAVDGAPSAPTPLATVYS